MEIFCHFAFALLQTQSIKDVLKEKTKSCIPPLQTTSFRLTFQREGIRMAFTLVWQMLSL